MNAKILAVAAIAALFALSGCAITSEQIALQYTPQADVAKVAGADQVGVTVTVVDLRQDKSRVSCKKNGFGMEMAPITASEEVAVTVQRAIETELRSRGFQPGSAAAQVLIATDLTRFYNEHKVGILTCDAFADLNLQVTVKTGNGAVRYTKMIAAQGGKTNFLVMSGETAKVALELALANGMKQLFEDQAFLAALLGGTTR